MARENYRPVEIPRSEPLIIHTGQKIFPFTDLRLPDETIGLFEFASQEFELKEEDGSTTGRFMYQDVLSNGNTGISTLVYLPERYYTMGSIEDDLRHDSETYPDSPHRRIMFTVAFDLPNPLDPESEFRKTTRIRIENGQTGNIFNAVEARAQGGYNRTRSPKEGHYSLLYDSYYYDCEMWNDRNNKPAHLDISNDRMAELLKHLDDHEKDNSYPYPQDLTDAHQRVQETDDRNSYLMPFRLAFITKPEVAGSIGVTIEKVPVGSIDLSVNTPDQVMHGH